MAAPNGRRKLHTRFVQKNPTYLMNIAPLIFNFLVDKLRVNELTSCYFPLLIFHFSLFTFSFPLQQHGMSRDIACPSHTLEVAFLVESEQTSARGVVRGIHHVDVA